MTPSLTRLTQLVPPAVTPEPKGWSLVENELGTALPQDYKELIDTYGGGLFDGVLWLLEPGCANKHYDILTEAEERTEAFELLWSHGEAKPPELEREGTRLIPWASTENGEFLYWLARPGEEPDDWTVMANEGRGPEWEHHNMTCVSFLLSALTGEVTSEIIWELPAADHSFRPSAEFV
ncbi:SMI1/KNR4 family protein [Streptomyces sp. NPDC051776]|uniref:SMI1/KNR4 family protein n=1 Tax=Streptomyces sp. NPDC051776 TaxID=3155414 RepID=UPI0034344498